MTDYDSDHLDRWRDGITEDIKQLTDSVDSLRTSVGEYKQAANNALLRWLLGGGALLIVTLVVGWFGVIDPISDNGHRANQRADALENRVDAQDLRIADISDRVADNARVSGQIEALRTGIDNLTRQMDRMADDIGVLRAQQHRRRTLGSEAGP